MNERLQVWLHAGDRLVLWTLALALVGLFIWHDKNAEANSPTLIAPTCVTIPTRGSN